LAALKFPDCQALVGAALNCATAEEVAALLEDFTSRREAPLIDPDLIILDCEALTKSEVIKNAADRLYVLGRTDTPRAIEEALWQSDQTNATQATNAIALLHCQTNAIHSTSLLLLKLATPIHWNSFEAEPVRVVLLCISRSTSNPTEHQKLLTLLSHRCATEPFRTTLCAETTIPALTAHLREVFPL
jgi:mannitol/fructose-specific phosphotransferase system IIA component (Ntr-type)